MHHSVFRRLPGFLLLHFEHYLLIGKRSLAEELRPTIRAIYAFLRGSAHAPIQHVFAHARTSAAKRWQKLLTDNGYYLD